MAKQVTDGDPTEFDLIIPGAEGNRCTITPEGRAGWAGLLTTIEEKDDS